MPRGIPWSLAAILACVSGSVACGNSATQDVTPLARDASPEAATASVDASGAGDAGDAGDAECTPNGGDLGPFAGDECQYYCLDGYYHCVGGKWVCPPKCYMPFTCDALHRLQCGMGEYCVEQALEAGVGDAGDASTDAGLSGACASVPSACGEIPTCACILPLLPPSCASPQCSESRGQVTVVCGG